MNILIPHSWLLEHLATEAEPEQIQHYLSLSGPSVERIYQLEGEPVYDIEVTTNRVDMMSVRGIAREGAVILKQFHLPAQLKKLKLPKLGQLQVGKKLPLPKILNDPQLNRRTMCVVLTQINRTPTPKWMAQKLIQTDIGVHEAAIDITNYVTHEFGHPCHAFDYDKLMATGGEIHITEAKAGETFVTLDDQSFKTVGGEVVFKNKQGKIIDLPSIKGTRNTSIDESTHNILLLMESIRPDKVRFASMTHAIRTTAAQLMEKGVDPQLMEPVMARAIELYQQLCQANLGSEVYDQFEDQPQPPEITLTERTVKQYLGIELPILQITAILEDLGCQVKPISGKSDQSRQGQPATKFKVTPPTFRPDLNLEVDLVEEIARIYGYHRLPSQLMASPIPTIYPQDSSFRLENKIKHFLAAIGWQELYTYSLVSSKLALDSGYQLSEQLKLQNPLTEDRVYLRRSLLPSLEEAVVANSQTNQLSVFEIAHVYHPQDQNSLPQEVLQLSLVSNRPYRQVRGELESLFNQLYIDQVEIKVCAQPSPQFSQQATVVATNQQRQKITLGKMGVLLSGRIGISLDVKALLQVARSHPTYRPTPNTMPIVEDLTFTLTERPAVGDVMTNIQKIDQLITSVELKDIYQHNYTFSVHYQHPQQNLTVAEIEPVRKKIVTRIQKKYQAQLVGQV